MASEAISSHKKRRILFKKHTLLLSSYLMGVVRLKSAQSVSYRASALFLMLNLNEQLQKFFADNKELSKFQIDRDRLNHFSYITEASFIIYLTTIFDSFLTDTIKFLMFLFPNSLSKDRHISMRSILLAKSKTDLLNEAIEKQSLEISHLSFLGKIDLLKIRFGIHLGLSKEILDQLKRYSAIRNSIVHDQSIFDIKLNSRHNLIIKQKACPTHPTQLKEDDFDQAEFVYNTIIKSLYAAVATQILKSNHQKEFRGAMEFFDRIRTTTNQKSSEVKST